MKYNKLHNSFPRNTLKGEIAFSVILGIFVLIILAIYQPFGTYNYSSPNKNLIIIGYAILVASGYIFNSFLLQKIAHKFYSEDNWNLWKEISHYSVIFFILFNLTFIYHNQIIGGNYSMKNYFGFLYISISVALFPISIIILLRYIQIKQRTNNNFEKVAMGQDIDSYINLQGSNKNESIRITSEELLFIKAADNYVEINLVKKNEIKSHMIRSSLINISKQLESYNIIQIHRSYLVNKDMIDSIKGKYPNYNLVLKSTSIQVPISRNRIKIIKEYLHNRPI